MDTDLLFLLRTGALACLVAGASLAVCYYVASNLVK